MNPPNGELQCYLVALSRIETAIYAVHPLSDVTSETTYRARDDVIEAIQRLRQEVMDVLPVLR